MDIENISIDISAKVQKAKKKLDEVGDDLRELSIKESQHGNIDINVDADYLSLERFRAELASITDKTVDVDTDRNQGTLGNFMDGIPSRQSSAGIGLGTKIRRLLPDSIDEDEGLRSIFSKLRPSMSKFYDILAQIIPLLSIFVGALPAVIAGLGTLALAAFSAAAMLAAIGGLGLLGLASARGGGGMPSGEEFQEIISDVGETLWEAFSPLASTLAPIAKGALDEIEPLAQDMATVLGPILNEMESNLSGFGNWFQGFILESIKTLGVLATSFNQLFGDMGDSINANMVSVIKDLIGYTKSILPNLSNFLGILGSFLPAIGKLSAGFLEVATNILMMFNALANMMSVLPVSTKQLGVIIAAFIGIYSIGTLLISLLSALYGAITTLYTAFQILSVVMGALGLSTLTLVTVLGALVIVIGLLVVMFTDLEEQLLSMLGIGEEMSGTSGGYTSSYTPSGGTGGAGGGDTYVQENNYNYEVNGGGRSDRELEGYRTYQSKKERKQSDSDFFPNGSGS